MKHNLKPRLKTINGVEYTLPPNVSWCGGKDNLRFIVQMFTYSQKSKKSFGVNKYGGVAQALEAASAYAKACEDIRATKPPFPVLGFDRHGKPLALGKGIYLQTNADRGNYQLFSVIYGSKLKGNYQRASLALGKAGYFTKRHWDYKLEEAKRLRAQWVEADRLRIAANNPDYKQAA